MMLRIGYSPARRLPISTKSLALLALLWQCHPALGAEAPPAEEYGKLPLVSAVTISPDGGRVAFRRTGPELDAMFVLDRLSNEVIGAVDGSQTNLRRISFLDQDRLLLRAEEAQHVRDIGSKQQISGSFVYSVHDKALIQLLDKSRHLFPYQTGLGRVIGYDTENDVFYMPGYVGQKSGTPPTYGLLSVSYSDPDGDLVTRGTEDTIDWFVDAHGNLLAEEVYDADDEVQRIYAWRGKKRQLLHKSGDTEPAFFVVGLNDDFSGLIVSGRKAGSDFRSYYEMKLSDGSIGDVLFQRDDTSVEHAIAGLDRRVYGVEYAGFLPRYEFFDDALTHRVRKIQDSLKNTAAYLVDWTPDFSHMVFRVSGGWSSGAYVLVQPGSDKPVLLAQIRPGIPREFVAPTTIIDYEASDGLRIPALVTARDDIRQAGHAPLIVMPHGGPSAYDKLGFDWVAQYFASRGIVVLQPQFRGSDGFGATFATAGRGQWGGDMSRDLDDGVKRLVDDGLVDAGHVCMVGFSYGGYATLAAGAFSAFHYKCLVSVSGISDLPRMLDFVRKVWGDDSPSLVYWQRQLGSEGKADRVLEDVSPVNFAEHFDAPVLLVHGKNDAVITVEQSVRMEKALRRAKKPVELLRLDGEDHYLSGYETRIKALRAVAEFVERNL